MPKYKTSINKEEINLMPIYQFDGKARIITKMEDALKAIKKLSKENVLGFDTETRPSFKKEHQNRVSLLQLTSSKETFLFRLNHLGLPKELTEILSSPEIIKAGVAIADDVKALQKLTKFQPEGFCDLSNMAKRMKIKNLGLRSLAAIFFGVRISKGSKLSNWENQRLTTAQINYAAIDSSISRDIYLYITENNLLPPSK